MKNRLIVGAALVANVLNAIPALAATSYPLMCRSGGNIELAFDSDTGLWVRFSKASAGFSRVQLQPGECAWSDRAISTAEPSALNQPYPGSVNIQWGPKFDAYGFGSQSNWLRDMTMGDDHFVTFQAYNDGSKLIITGYKID